MSSPARADHGLDDDPEQIGPQHGGGDRDRPAPGRILETDRHRGHQLTGGQPQAAGYRGRGRGQLDLQCPEVYDLYVRGYAIGALWILNHPGAALDLMGRKIGYTIGFLAHGYFIDDLGAGAGGTRRRVDLIDPAAYWLLPIHLILVLAGLVILRTRPVALGLLGAPIAALLASALLFYGYVRLGAAYLPVLWILEGAAIAAGLQRFATRRPATPRTVAIAMTILIVLLGADALRSGSPRELRLDGARMPDGALVQDETLTVHRVQ